MRVGRRLGDLGDLRGLKPNDLGRDALGSRADLGEGVREVAQHDRGWRASGRPRRARPSRRRTPPARVRRPRRASRRSRRRRKAARTRAASAGARRAASRARPSSSAQVAAFSPKVIGTACWPCVLPAMGVSACSIASVAGRVPGRAVEIAADRSQRRARLEHERRVDDVLRRRAPVHPAARVAAPLDERPDQRHERVLRRRDPVAQLGEVVAARVRPPPRSAPRRPRQARHRPRPAPRRARRSTSSHACTSARESKTARTSAVP